MTFNRFNVVLGIIMLILVVGLAVSIGGVIKLNQDLNDLEVRLATRNGQLSYMHCVDQGHRDIKVYRGTKDCLNRPHSTFINKMPYKPIKQYSPSTKYSPSRWKGAK